MSKNLHNSTSFKHPPSQTETNMIGPKMESFIPNRVEYSSLFVFVNPKMKPKFEFEQFIQLQLFFFTPRQFMAAAFIQNE